MVRCLGTREPLLASAQVMELSVLKRRLRSPAMHIFLSWRRSGSRARGADLRPLWTCRSCSEATTESLVGLGAAWKEPPLALARAYLQLEKEQQSPSAEQDCEGNARLGGAWHGARSGRGTGQ